MKQNIIENLKNVKLNILNICKRINRDPSNINIVAVSKQQDMKIIKELLAFEHKCYGENRLDEAQKKWGLIKKESLNLHYIGALQSKKVKKIYEIFDVIETLDTESAAEKIASCNVKNKKRFPKIFVQINLGGEIQKRGIPLPQVEMFIKMCKERFNLSINGAMCIPPMNSDPLPHFKSMKEICTKHNLKNISMGMSGDYVEAIRYGSTNIRIGTSIFGSRK